MISIGLIREEKIPPDNRVALTPAQCKWLQQNRPVKIVVQSSPIRCFTNAEYMQAGITVTEDVSDCDILFGIKEVPVGGIVPNKTYLFFSHTKKQQPHNRELFCSLLKKQITLIDYECLEHEDGQRILGFGFFAGVVGAHNGIMAYGKRSGLFDLGRVYRQRDLRALIHTYFGLKLPPIKVVVTGSGRVAHGILEVMNLVGMIEVEPDEYLSRDFNYPVFTQLKGRDLYTRNNGTPYDREHFHSSPQEYKCLFPPYATVSDILMNGIYWDVNVPRLFEWHHFDDPSFRIQTIADITDDTGGSVPCNLGDSTIEDPVYGVHKKTHQRTAPFTGTSVDVMAVGNLPNELPRDASRYFGEQLINHVIDDLLGNGSHIIERATMMKAGKLTEKYGYLKEYGSGL